MATSKPPYQEYYYLSEGRIAGPGLRIEYDKRKYRALVISPYAGRVMNPDAPWVGSRARALAILAKTHPKVALLGVTS